MRTLFLSASVTALLAIALVAILWPPVLWCLFLVIPLIALGVWDCAQDEHAVLRNFPVVGHFRYLFEMIRPEISQYFIETNTNGMPFNREFRSVVYQRAKGVQDTLPFGTQRDVYEPGYEWMHHSLCPKKMEPADQRVLIGKRNCKKPYSASVFQISAMSFGSLSNNAVRALNAGAKAGNFAHNTGEGGVSPYHLEAGGDLIWQVGTGYFGCRTQAGGFDPTKFAEMATRDSIKMIEIKLSQGAKPGHGGILPGAKVTPEIARIRGVPVGKDVVSPPAHTRFDSPTGLLEFVAELRELSGDKPVGFKLCVGDHREFMCICKAMIETGLQPDFITVDGGEGGTGAAPLEFSNSLGTPLNEGLVFVHNTLVGSGLRDDIKIIASGKIITGFHLATKLALGADIGASARGMLFAIGCIQALRCNTNHCPVGVTTQDPRLVNGLVVESKAERVHAFHEATVEAFCELLGAAGLSSANELGPWHIYRRITETETRHFAQIHSYIEPGALLTTPLPRGFARDWSAARPDCW